MSGDNVEEDRIVVRGTEILPSDPRQRYREKIARVAFDSMAQFVGLLDARGTVLEINKAALDTAGITLADVEGKLFWTTFWWQVSKETSTELREMIARAAEGEFVRWDAQIYGRAGGKETIIIDASLTPVMDDAGKVVFICAEGRDITEMKAREHAARQEAELLHSLFMQAPSLILILRGPDHVIELANPPVCQSFKRSPEELLNRPLFDVMPDLRDQAFPALLEGVYRTGVPHFGKETPATFVRRGGTSETVYFNFVYSPFRNFTGEIDGIFVIASDVTEQVMARNQVDELRRAAESANRAKDEFLAMLGHELRNPLSPILTALELMKLRGEAGSERERTVIERQVTHLTRLVDDLLDVSRIARGKVELKTELVEMAEVIAKAIEMASPLLEQRNHTLTLDVPRSGLRVEGDPTRLGQVISNLLTNAAKYTPPGGDVFVRAEQVGDEVVLSVRDTGIGISPDVLPSIFDLFVQGRQALDRSQGGLGIGLTIVRSLIERHGGSISARSEGPGKGTEFIVRLPAAVRAHDVSDRAETPERLRKPTVPPGSARILIVDDNEDGAQLLAQVLTGRGYDTRVAHDAPTALRVAREFAPDVAFLDIGLPVMDGYELASHLREIPGLEGLRLIAITGYGQDSDRRRTRKAGFHHHLVKPVDIDAIEAALNMRSAPDAE
ncbi:MAG: response regulator [Acidobacteria bacterium]|nr:MAG: response regulator [Acidobacteriota bacterium]